MVLSSTDGATFRFGRNFVSQKTSRPGRRAGRKSVLLGRRLIALALVDLAVSPQVRDDGEVAATALNLASECYNMLVACTREKGSFGGMTHASRPCGCTCGSEESLGA